MECLHLWDYIIADYIIAGTARLQANFKQQTDSSMALHRSHKILSLASPQILHK